MVETSRIVGARILHQKHWNMEVSNAEAGRAATHWAAGFFRGAPANVKAAQSSSEGQLTRLLGWVLDFIDSRDF
jgi:hypothetical protein